MNVLYSDTFASTFSFMTHKRITFFIFSTILMTCFAYGQTSFEDVLYLKNGGIIHGIIIEQVPNESLKIQTKDRNVFVYRMDEVLKITKEELPVPRKGRERLTKDNIKRKGYTNITEITFGRSVLKNGSDMALTGGYSSGLQPSFGIQTINGYLFNPYLCVGVGIGLHSYTDFSYVPLFIGARVNFLNGPLTPFLALDGGYSFTAKEIYGINNELRYFGGTYFNPAVGVKFNTRKSKALAFSIGYRSQETRIYVSNYGFYSNYNNNNVEAEWRHYYLGYLNLKIGFIF